MRFRAQQAAFGLATVIDQPEKVKPFLDDCLLAHGALGTMTPGWRFRQRQVSRYASFV